MENTTMTSRTFYMNVINANISDEMTAFAESALEKLDKRNSSRKEKGTKTQHENTAIKSAIINAMDRGTTYTAAEISSLGIDGITSTQKASALMRQLVESGEVTETTVKIKGKGKVKGYTLVTVEE